MENKGTADFFLERRILPIGKITLESIAQMTVAVAKLNMQSAEGITLLIDSPGGSLESSMHFYDFVKCCRTPFTAVVMEACHSAAINILVACGKRLSLPHAKFLLHATRVTQEFSEDEYSAEVIKNTAHRLKTVHGWSVALQAKETRLKEEKIQELMHQGHRHKKLLTPEEMKKLGYIHEIVPSFPIFRESPEAHGSST